MHRPVDAGQVGHRAVGEQRQQAAARALEDQQAPAGSRRVVRHGRLQPQCLGRLGVRLAVVRGADAVAPRARPVGLSSGQLIRQVQGERAAAAELALRSDLPAEQGADLAGDRQAEAGPAVPPAERAVALLERAEDRGEVLRRDADPGVADRERQHLAAVGGAPPGPGHAQQHVPVLGELDRIRQQVTENLAEPLPVGEQLARRLGARLDREIQPLLGGERLERGLDILE